VFMAETTFGYVSVNVPALLMTVAFSWSVAGSYS